MKKLITLLLCTVTLLSLCACKKTCKADDCEKDATKDGYCDYHYALVQAKNQLDDLSQGLFDALS